MSAPVEPKFTGQEQLRATWPHLRPDLGWYAAAVLVAPLTAGLAVLQPWLLKATIDQGITVGDADALARFAAGYLAAGVAGFVLEAVYTLTIGVGATRSITRLRDAVYDHTLRLAPSFHDREPTGKLLTRVTSDVEALGDTLTAGAFTIVLDLLLVGGVLAAMFALDAKLTGVLLLVAPPLALAIDVIRRRMRALWTAIRTHLAELIAFAAERITGIEVVQLYSDEARAERMYGDRLERYRRANVATNVWDALLFALVDGVSAVTMALMLWYATSPWFEGAATAGLLAAFVDYVGRLFTPVRELSNKLSILQRAASSVDKIAGLLLRDEVVRYGARALPEAAGDVELDRVSFAYGGGSDVLRDVSLRVRPGEVVALVGRTGSGKSTIGKLLTRMYDGYRGDIRVDGVPLHEVSREALRARVSVVQQDVVLFGGTVRFNLTLGAPISDERLAAAIAQAQVGEVVDRLGGLDGTVAHAGRNLSVGEAQLLSFARVLARDTPLVILDEATASVDSLTEARIRAATEALLARRTVLVVAHRLSTITHADRIVLIDAGRVVEQGSHAELLARGGAYAALFDAHHGVVHDPARDVTEPDPPATDPS